MKTLMTELQNRIVGKVETALIDTLGDKVADQVYIKMEDLVDDLLKQLQPAIEQAMHDNPEA